MSSATEMQSASGLSRPGPERAQEPAAPVAARWVPIASFVFLMLGLARNAGLGISDPDTLWHVLAGHRLAQSWSFAGPDPLGSFTVHPFVMHQWLPDLAFAGADSAGGLPAVAWLAQLLRIGICVSLYFLCRRWASPLPAALVAGLAVLGTADSLSPRPQLVGFVLLAVFVWAWLKTAEDGLARWWLVPLSWLWASSHGTWVIGIMVGTVAIVGMVLDRTCTVRQSLRLSAIPALGVVVAALTPLGPELFESFAAIRSVSPFIQEWRTPTLDSASVIAALALAVMTASLWAVRRRRVPWTHILLYALAVGWGAMHMRTVAVGAILIAPVAAGALESVLGRTRVPLFRRETTVVVIGAALSVGLAALLAASGPDDPVGVPDGLDPELSALPPGTTVYNADVLGGWLMWSHPGLRFTRDTRAELYGPGQARDYLRVMAAEPGWERILERFEPGAALVPDHAPLVKSLLERRWTIVGRDGGYALLKAPGSYSR